MARARPGARGAKVETAGGRSGPASVRATAGGRRLRRGGRTLMPTPPCAGRTHRRRLGGSAARRLGGSAARRLGGSAARRLGGSAARRLGGSAARRLGGHYRPGPFGACQPLERNCLRQVPRVRRRALTHPVPARQSAHGRVHPSKAIPVHGTRTRGRRVACQPAPSSTRMPAEAQCTLSSADRRPARRPPGTVWHRSGGGRRRVRRRGPGGNRGESDVRGGDGLRSRRGRAMTAFMLRGALARCATRRVGLAALAGVLACVAGLVWRHHRLGGLELLDARGGCTPEEAAALLDALDANARLVYAATGFTIDMAFPLAYGLLFAIVLVRLFRAPLFVLALALAGADVLENLTVAALALGHAGAPSPVAWLAGFGFGCGADAPGASARSRARGSPEERRLAGGEATASCDTGGTDGRCVRSEPSAAPAAGLARSGPNPAWRSAGSPPPMARRGCSPCDPRGPLRGLAAGADVRRGLLGRCGLGGGRRACRLSLPRPALRARIGAKGVVTGGTRGLAASGGKGIDKKIAREALVTAW